MPSNKNVPVLSRSNKVISYTSSAKARILLRRGKALAFNTDPFIIKLKGELGENEMSTREFVGSTITNFSRYFREEREVYVQNLGSTQISISFPTGTGVVEHLVIPATRKPYDLTSYIDFNYIKASMDFRKLVNHRPAILRLLDEDEYISYYVKRAQRNGTTVEEEFDEARKIIDGLINKQSPPREQLRREQVEKLEKREEELQTMPEIHPRVVGLCARADKDAGTERISASDFIEELESMEDILSVDDWEFVSAKGFYKTVKSFSNKKLEKLLPSEEE